jgi:hypothetical protein
MFVARCSVSNLNDALMVGLEVLFVFPDLVFELQGLQLFPTFQILEGLRPEVEAVSLLSQVDQFVGDI